MVRWQGIILLYFRKFRILSVFILPRAVNLTEQDAIPEVAGGTVIGALSSPVKGVLVLETTDKALILPKTGSPHLNIVKPMAGTICYDTNKKMMCVYNGTEWSFWK